jgi:hypothetical protein
LCPQANETISIVSVAAQEAVDTIACRRISAQQARELIPQAMIAVAGAQGTFALCAAKTSYVIRYLQVLQVLWRQAWILCAMAKVTSAPALCILALVNYLSGQETAVFACNC